MKEELLKKVEELDKEYFGNRSLSRLISALAAQVVSLQKEPTVANARKQAGDALFVLVAMARNMGWDLEELVQEVVVKIENRRANRHYYESHVTTEPVFGKRLEEFKEICAKYDFHVATLLMKKRPKDTPTRSANDSFCTARGISYSDLQDRTLALLRELEKADFQVWRYKIESTLLDSRYDDSDFPLKQDQLPEKEKSPRAPAKGALPGRKQ